MSKQIDNIFVFWIIIAVIGGYLHQILEFPEYFGFIPDYVIPMILMLLIVSWGVMYKAGEQISYSVGLGFALVNLLGAILTVYPFDFLPFIPEQSLNHYISHLLFGMLQLPLLYFSILQIKKIRSIDLVEN